MPSTARFDVGPAALDARVINGFRPPVTGEVRGYYRLEPAYVSDGRVVNLVNPGTSAVISGTPTVEADGITFTGLSHFLDTLLPESPDQTFVTLGWAPEISNTLRPWIMGNYNPALSPVRGVGLYLDGLPSGQASPQGVIRANEATTPNGGTTVNLTVTDIVSPNVTVPECLAAVWTQGVGAAVYNLTRGTQAAVAAPNPRAVAPSTIRLGSSYANYTGRWKGRRAVYHGRALSKAELDRWRAYWLTELAAAATPLVGF